MDDHWMCNVQLLPPSSLAYGACISLVKRIYSLSLLVDPSQASMLWLAAQHVSLVLAYPGSGLLRSSWPWRRSYPTLGITDGDVQTSALDIALLSDVGNLFTAGDPDDV